MRGEAVEISGGFGGEGGDLARPEAGRDCVAARCECHALPFRSRQALAALQPE